MQQLLVPGNSCDPPLEPIELSDFYATIAGTW